MEEMLQIGLATSPQAVDALIDRYSTWIDSVVGAPASETLTFESEFPFSHLVLEDLLTAVDLDRQCMSAVGALRDVVKRWELPPGVSPRIELHASHDRSGRITDRKPAWDPHWKETPMALWLNGCSHALVSVVVPYVSFRENATPSWGQWIVVRRDEAAACLRVLRGIRPRPEISVIAGRPIPLPLDGYDWDRVVLDPAVNASVREDYHTFWQREKWFAGHGLPYRRGYLLYGPPGNGKTTVARIMACHPLVTPFTIDFSVEGLPNDALSDLFRAASDNAPALVILEDLDRVFGMDACGENRTAITLSHLLNCLDGLGSQDGVVVVATANDPAKLDPALLKRPGRFDRLAQFGLPSAPSRAEYLRRLTGGKWEESAITVAAQEAGRLSFAQIREGYILAGQASFLEGGDVRPDHLLAGLRRVRTEVAGVNSRLDGKMVGFSGQDSGGQVESRFVSQKR